MATIEELGLVEVRVTWTLGSHVAQCTQFWREIGGTSQFGTTAANLATFAGLVGNHLDADWRAYRPPSSVLAQVTATKYQTATPPRQGVVTPNLAGTNGFDSCMPTQNALVLSYRTNFVGRSFRGRNYLPFIAQNAPPLDVSGDEVFIQEAVCTALENQYPVGMPLDDTGGGSHTMQLVVYSRTRAQTEFVTSVVVDPEIDTMRSRKR